MHLSITDLQGVLCSCLIIIFEAIIYCPLKKRDNSSRLARWVYTKHVGVEREKLYESCGLVKNESRSKKADIK